MGRSMPRWEPPAETLSHFPAVSGNTVNGLGEDEQRPPSPFFWHDPSLQTHGELQAYVLRRLNATFEVGRQYTGPQYALAPISAAVQEAARPHVGSIQDVVRGSLGDKHTALGGVALALRQYGWLPLLSTRSTPAAVAAADDDPPRGRLAATS